jgi:hypothetical protein
VCSSDLDGSPLKVFAGQQHDAHILSHILFALSPTLQAMPNVVVTLQKHLLEHIKTKAEEFVEAQLFREYGVDPDKLVSALQREAMIALKAAEFYQEAKALQEQLSGANEPPTDPLIELKKQELAQSAKRDEAKIATDQARMALDQQRENNDMMVDQARLQQAGQTAKERNAVTLVKGNKNVQ